MYVNISVIAAFDIYIHIAQEQSAEFTQRYRCNSYCGCESRMGDIIVAVNELYEMLYVWILKLYATLDQTKVMM